MKFVKEFIASKRNAKYVLNAMDKFNRTPNLARNLVGIYESCKSDIESSSYNPWYSEMKKAGITLKDITVFKQYIAFEERMSEKERAQYTHCNPYFNQSHCLRFDGVDTKSLN